jgi:ABC-2 type transport system permease protein
MSMSTVDRVGFGGTLASEWTKLTSLRSVRVTLVLSVLLGVGLTALLSWVVVLTWDEWPAEERAAFDAVESSLVGTLVAALLVTVLGVTVVSSEYSSRMIALTLTATPRRERVLLAKVIVVAVLTLAASLVGTAGMVLVGQLFSARLDVPPADWSDTVGTLLGVVAGAPLLPVIAVCLTFVLRSAAGSVAAVLGLVLGPAVFGPLLPRWWREHGQDYLPSAASDSLLIPELAGPGGLSRGLAAVVLAGWLVLFLGGAAAVLDRRDA